MKLAVSGQLLSKSTALPDIIRLLKTLDVDAIELWPRNLPGGADGDSAQRYEQKDVVGARHLLENEGMAVACVTLGFNVLSQCREAGAAYGAAALKGAVDAAAALGAPIVNCYLAGLAPSVFVAAMQPAAEYAGSAGVTIVLENEAHDDSGPAARVREIVEAVASPYFGTQYDPCNYYHANEESYPAAYEVVKDYVRYVHLKGGCLYDATNRPRDKRGGTMRGSADRYIGYTSILDGCVNADAVLRRLAADGYRGYVTLEPHVPVEQALDYYRIDVPYVRERIQHWLTVAAA
ncbi:MAG: sugar phosphate isomerase/epimerase family protein [Thermomicrobiales bacterium]